MSLRRMLAVAVLAAAAATPATAAGPISLTIGPTSAGHLQAVGYAPDFQVGCSTSLFTAELMIDPMSGAAIGIAHGECGVQSTILPPGSCRSNLPARPGFSCSNVAADGTRRYASTSSSEPTRRFSFSEIGDEVWFQADGVGAGAG